MRDAGPNPHAPIANMTNGKLDGHSPSKVLTNGSSPTEVLTNGKLNGHLSIVDGMPDCSAAVASITTSNIQSPTTLSHACPMHEVLPIAVIGMACRLPGGSSSPEKLWDMLASGKSAWSKIPSERFTQSSFEHPNSSVGGTVSTIHSDMSLQQRLRILVHFQRWTFPQRRYLAV